MFVARLHRNQQQSMTSWLVGSVLSLLAALLTKTARFDSISLHYFTFSNLYLNIKQV
jgi:hypothetical protein